MATTAEQVQLLYIGLLGRAADAEGLNYWVGEIDAGNITLEEVRANIVNEQPEYNEGMGEMSRPDLVTQLYQNLFKRDPDPAGLEYWVNGGGSSVNADQLILALIDGASVADLQVLDNKATAANYYTNSPLGTDFYDQGAATAAVAMVDGTQASLDASITFTDSFGADSDVFTLTQLPSQETVTLLVGTTYNAAGEIVSEGAPAELVLEFLQDVAGLDLLDLGIIDENGDAVVEIESININADSIAAGDEIVEIYLDTGASISASVNNAIDESFGLVTSALFGSSIRTVSETDQFGIVLTPFENNGGTFEPGVTSTSDDAIYAGRPELLQGAYIDGGAGYNTLDVDMKGFFAQPLQLLNIQEVRVQNLDNVYTVSQTFIEDADLNIPVPIDGITGNTSILDLSRATSLGTLRISEGFMGFAGESGGLVVSGIQNFAFTSLSGDFNEDVDLYYGPGQFGELNIELVNVSFGGGSFSVNQNTGLVNLGSEGVVNTLNDVDFGDNFFQLNVFGSALLSIEDDLNFDFGEATIDASGMGGGGVRLALNSQTGTATLEEITIIGSGFRDVFDINDATDSGVLLNIDTGAGRDLVRLNSDISAGAGSVVTGENLTVEVAAFADMREADVSGVDEFTLTSDGGLLLGQAQVLELGAAVFVADHNTVPTLSIEVSESGTVLSDLIDLSTLDSDVKLAFNVEAGASLDLTAAQLHNWVAEDGIVGEGTVNLSGVGLNFDIDDATSIGDGVGTIDNFDGTLNVVRQVGGFERPGAADDSDVLVIDTTGTGGVVVEANEDGDDDAFTTDAETVIIGGPDDITFNAPVEMTASDFTLDFSFLTGALNNLTIRDFDNVEEVIGNGAPDVRINVEIDGDVAEEGEDTGLISSGVAQYVVTDMNGGDHDFNVCDQTQDVEVLGLWGNAGTELTFTNIPWGAVNPTILFEGDGAANWDELPKAAGNPDESNVGTIVAEFFFPGAPAAILITNQGVAPGLTSEGEDRPIVVDGIELENASSVDITIEDGNAVIESLEDNGSDEGDSLEDVSFTSANDVTLTVDSGNDDQNIDASAVAGTMTLFVVGDVTFADGELIGIDAVVMQDGSTLELTTDQVTTIGAANFSVENEGDAAELNIGEFGSDPFDFTTLTGIEGITVNTVTMQDGTTVVDPTTDFTGIQFLAVPTGADVTISVAQLEQLVDSGAQITTGAESTPGAGDAGVLTVDMDGDLTIGDDVEGVIGGANVVFDAADGETLSVETFSLADGLQVSGDAAAATVPLVNFLFNNTDPATAPVVATIDVSAYEGVDLKIRDSLLNNFVNQNIEQLLENLASANILNIEATPDELVEEDPRDRTIVVESDAMPEGITIDETGTIADFVRTVDITLEADADSAALIDGDLVIDDGDAAQGGSLTVNTVDTDGGAVGPATISGQVFGDADLVDVTINAAVDLVIEGEVFFSSTVADAAATLTITGDADVTIKALDATTPNVTSLTVDTSGYTGTLTLTGGSDSMELNETGTLVFVGDGDVVLDTDEDAGNNGIEGNILTGIDASEHTGSLTLGVIEDIDNYDFTFAPATGATTLTLEGVVLSTNDAGPNDTAASWTFDMNAETVITVDGLTITNDPATGEEASLSFTGADGTLIIASDLDLTGLDSLDVSGLTTIEVAADASLSLSPQQLDALNAAGVTVVKEAGDPAAVPPTVDGTLAVLGVEGDLTAANEDLDADIDLSQADSLDLSGDATLSGEQVSGKAVDAGGFALTLTNVAPDTDLSGITNTGALTVQAGEAETTLALAAAVVSGVTLTVEGDALETVEITGVEAVVVPESDPPQPTDGQVDADFSGLTANGPGDVDIVLQLDSTGNAVLADFANFGATPGGAGTTTLVISGDGEVSVDSAIVAPLQTVDSTEVQAGATLVLTASQETFVGGSVVVEGEGTLQVTGLGDAMASLDATDAADSVDYLFSFTETANSTVTIAGFTPDSSLAVDKLDFTALFEDGTQSFEQIATAFATVNQTGTADIIAFDSGLGTVDDALGLEEALDGDTVDDFFTATASPVNFGFSSERIFFVEDSTGNTDGYNWVDGNDDGLVAEGELTQLVEITAVPVNDLISSNFAVG